MTPPTPQVLGCTVAFALGRTVVRDWAQQQFGRHELLRAVDCAISQQPIRICVIVRLAWVPIAFKNYGFAVLNVRARDYILSLVTVELVMSAVLVSVGAAAKDLGAVLSGEQPKSPWQIAAMVVGMGFLFVFVSYVAVVTRRALDEIRARRVRSQ